MQEKTIVLTVILFALIVLGMFVYAKIKAGEEPLGMSTFDFVIISQHEDIS